MYVVSGVGVGVNICEDIWYPGQPTEAQANAGAQVIVNINGSPYHAGKRHFREEMLARRASDYGVWICYTNMVGGQDELVFDGGSMVLTADGVLAARAAMFEEELLVADLMVADEPRYGRRSGESVGSHPPEKAPGKVILSEQASGATRTPVEVRVAPELPLEEEVYAALVLGTRDYLFKTGFSKALVALSGGIDSSLVAAVAADALGPENVIGISMPSRYSSEGSIQDAKELAENLGIELDHHPDRAGAPGDAGHDRTGVRGEGHPEAGDGRGEHPVAHPGQRDHGAFQQTRVTSC